MQQDMIKEYGRIVNELFNKILKSEESAILHAAQLMANTIEQDKLIHVIGPGGHSNIGTYEMFYRAGGLVPVNPILDPGTLLNSGGRRSTVIERMPGYGIAVLEAYDIKDGVLIIVNAYGINTMCIDVALEAKRRNIPTIGVTSREFAEKTPPDHPARHPSKKNLCDVVNVHVDCHMPPEDAVVEIEKINKKVGPTSTLVNVFTLNLMVVKTVELLINKGIEPPIWVSANTPGGDQKNEGYLRKYVPRIKLL